MCLLFSKSVSHSSPQFLQSFSGLEGDWQSASERRPISSIEEERRKAEFYPVGRLPVVCRTSMREGKKDEGKREKVEEDSLFLFSSLRRVFAGVLRPLCLWEREKGRKKKNEGPIGALLLSLSFRRTTAYP